jgi:hypothetical protein
MIRLFQLTHHQVRQRGGRPNTIIVSGNEQNRAVDFQDSA